MSGRYLLGLDAGGSGGRALLLDAGTGAVTTAARAWSHAHAPGSGGLGFDLDLVAIWRRLGEAAREALARAGARPEDVAGVAATSMRFALAVLDERGEAVYAGPNRDARAVGECFALAARHGESLARETGRWPVPVSPAPRLLWLRDKGGEAWTRAHRLVALSDWVAFRLCGEIAGDPSHAAESGLFDVASGGWSQAWIERLGLPRALFPELREPGTRLGALRDDAAQALGLRRGIPVAVGGGDTQCGLLGAGALEPGELGIVAGTTAPVQLVTSGPVVDPRLWPGRHVVASHWVLESNAGPVGEALEWLARLLFGDAPHAAARLLAEAARGEPGASGLFSSLAGEIFDARAMNLPVGELRLSHLATAAGPESRAQLARAVVEGAAFALRANLEQLVQATGAQPPELRLCGGLSRSRIFAEVLAEATGRRVLLSASPDASAFGAALLAGVGAGIFDTPAEGARALARPRATVEPDASRSARSDQLYARWRELRAAGAAGDQVSRGALIQSVLARGAQATAATRTAWRPRILVTADLDLPSLAALREIGEVEYAPFRKAMRLLTGASLVEALHGVGIFVTEVDVVDARSLAQLPELRAVATCRGDAVNVDVAAATALGIPVLHAPGRNADAVADLTVAFLLMLARKLPEATAFLREPGGEAGDVGRMGRAFRALRGRELFGKTVGLVGLGAVGRGVARRLEGFGVRLLVHDPFLADEAIAAAGGEPAPLDELLAASDFVSLHAAVSEGSRGLLGAAELARMKAGACLVNTARAALVDEEALLQALRSGHLAGAALDVFRVEPPGADDPLLALPNVIATPHVGGNTEDVAGHQGRIVGEDLARLVRGERPLHLLDPAAFERFDPSRPRPALDPATLERLAARPGPTVTDLEKSGPGARAREAPAPVPHPAPGASPPSAEVGPIRERMQAILRAFLERILSSRALDPHARDKDVTLHFNLNDLGLAFWLRLRQGSVSADLGSPDAAAEVQLKLAADVFDGMFTGRANPMQAAMDGRLSFAGDTAKAMSLQEFQPVLSRLYREARDAVGDPGDLTALARTGAAAAAPVEPGDVRREIVTVVGELYAQQLITATGGNVSARISGSDELWITPSQLFKGDLRPEVLVRIDLLGNALDDDARAPSSERLMHCAAYRARPDAGAVIHAHAPHATILANTGLPFLPISTEAAFFADLPRVPFIMPGTQDLADAIAAAMKESWAVLMQNHGLLVAGRSLRRAADMVEIVERTCEVLLGCYAVGKPPPVLPDDVVARLRAMGDLVA